MSEQLVMRTHGGPWAGTRLVDLPWPLPETVPDPEQRGEYRKTRQSKLDGPIPGIARGAEYEWHPASPEWA
jgi:hypothetical protein